MKQKVVIFGAGKTADHVRFYLENDSSFAVCGFTVDKTHLDRETHERLPVVAFEDAESVFPPSEYGMVIAISFVGVNSARADKYAQAKAKGYALVTYISSRAITWPGLIIGDNCRVHEGCAIQPFAEIGNDVVLGSGTVIGHHSIVGDHCFISGNATVSGNVTVEPFCFIGAGATIRDKITIARGGVIGAGAVILKNTKEKGVYRGQSGILLPQSSDALPKI